jgi:molybdenum cofactor cytidylyltransferase
MQESKFAAIVLAAGMSQRMGQRKMLLPFGDRPMLARIVETLRATKKISPIIVVTGHDAQEIAPVVDVYEDVRIAHNPAYATGGMLSSVQTGVRSLPQGSRAFFLALGDQPGVAVATLLALGSAWEETEGRMILPTYQGRRGHPVLFSARDAPEILALPSDATLKTFVSRVAGEIVEVRVSDPAVLADVDTPEDYERALHYWRAQDTSHRADTPDSGTP